MKIYLYYIGKARDPYANAIAAEYLKRTNRYLQCEMREIQPARFDLFSRQPGAKKILLDPEGKQIDSGGFTKLVAKAELEAQDIVFVVGGADGHPQDWKERADMLLSLSAMTFPHELARAMLTEQLYRAVTGMRGHPYPR